MTHDPDLNITMPFEAEETVILADAGLRWSTDLSQAPRDGSPVILALNGKTFKSYWCNPQIDPPHWCFLSHKQTPEAWMPWPEYPDHSAPAEQETAA